MTLDRGPFPLTRLRRTRGQSYSRDLMAETSLTVKDLIYPVFFDERLRHSEPIKSMPGISRLSLNDLWAQAEDLQKLGIPAIALFPVIAPELKSPDGYEALNPEGLVPRVIRELRQRFPNLGVISDLALDPYTTHGQDGIINSAGQILNDETIKALNQQALCHAEAGVSMVAPSDMMDGRVGAIRQSLERGGYSETLILSYAAKYASHFYGPFRDALGSKASGTEADKRTYQMDPRNRLEALHEASLDLGEGADILMVKPALPYLDIITLLKTELKAPLFAYQVSGEYAMLEAAHAQGWLRPEETILESLYAIKRAGADAILTYYAPRVAPLL